VPEDLAMHACLHHRYATSGKLERWPLRRDGSDVDIVMPSAAVANTIEPLIAMAEQGLGIACLPDNALQRQLGDGTLRTVLDDYVEHDGPFRLLWPSSRYPSPKLRAFVQFMAQNLFATSPTSLLCNSPLDDSNEPRHDVRPSASAECPI
jgi:DNA-binding transcriptional LysR family regulator